MSAASLLVFCLLALNIDNIVGNVIPLTRIPKTHNIHSSKRTAGETISVPGGISTTGEFYAQIGLGTPAQLLFVQVDTGSSDLLVYGSTCATCPGSVSYTVASSSTVVPVSCHSSGYYCPTCVAFDGVNTCQYQDIYGSGSANGTILTDKFSVGHFSNIQVGFGYISFASPNFENNPVDGIWGLSYNDLSFTSMPVFDNLVSQTGILNTFSMCLIDGAGTLTMGVDYSTNANFSWTPIIRQEWYNVNVTGMKVGGTALALNSAAFNNPVSIVDSGTTLLLVPTTVYNSIKSALQARCPGLVGICGVATGQSIFDGYCYTMTATQLNTYPNVSVVLNGITSPLNVTPQHYMRGIVSGGRTYYCYGIGLGGSFGTILGDVFMGGYHVAFDRIHNKIGFAPTSTCPTPN